MIENKIDKAMKPVPTSYEEFDSFPKHVEEFFDLPGNGWQHRGGSAD